MDRLSRPGAGAPTDAGAADTQPAGTRALARGIEAVVLVALLALAVVARRPDYLLSHSFWLDEGWVIDSVRAPLRQIGLMTTSTPVGWTLLLRAVPPLGGPERYRLLPLAFAVATVVLAWLLARRLGRLGVLRAVVAAACLALLPASLARHDLKQYTAEGFVAVGVVLLVVWIEERWSGRRLALLASLGAASILIANAAPMLALAGLGALTLTPPAAVSGAGPARRPWPRRRWPPCTCWSTCGSPVRATTRRCARGGWPTTSTSTAGWRPPPASPAAARSPRSKASASDRGG